MRWDLESEPNSVFIPLSDFLASTGFVGSSFVLFEANDH